MQRLNIPLRTGQTTRRDRRVVWKLALLLLTVFCAFVVVRLLVNRVTLDRTFPEHIVIDVVGRGAIATATEQMGTLPLLVGRPITLYDLAPYMRGEFALAVHPTSGERAVAIRGKIPDDVQTDWEGVGVYVDVRGGLTFISSDAAPSEEVSPPPSVRPLSFLPAFAGVVRLPDGGSRNLFVGNSQWTLRLPSDQADLRPPTHFPAGTMAWSAFSPHSTADFFSPLLHASRLDNEILALLKEETGSVLVIQDENGVGYRLTFDGTIDSGILANLSKVLVSLQSPLTQVATLPDRTAVEELRFDPSLVQVSQTEHDGRTVISAELDEDSLHMLQNEAETVVTNRGGLVDIVHEGVRTSSSCLGGASLYIFPKEAARSAAQTTLTNDSSLIFFYTADEIAVSSKKIRICL